MPLRANVRTFPLVLVLLVAFLAAPFGAVSGAQADGARASLSGTAVTWDGGQTSVAISLYRQTRVDGQDIWAPAGGLTTAAGGPYEFRDLEPGTYRVGVRTYDRLYLEQFWPGAATLEEAQDIELLPGESRTGLLTTLAATQVVSGTVRSTSGAPLSGARVETFRFQNLQGSNPTWIEAGQTVTRDDGTYRIPAQPGTYRVGFYDGSGRYVAQYGPGSDDFDTAQSFGVTRKEGRVINADLEAWSSVSGVATSGGSPLKGHKVTLVKRVGSSWQDAASVTTSSAGTYTFAKVRAGTYTLRLTDPDGYFFTTYWPQVTNSEDAEPIAVAEGDQLQGRNFQPELGAPINGQVRGSNDQVAGQIEVTAYRLTGTEPAQTFAPYSTVLADGGGRFRLSSLPAGTYRVGFTDLTGEYTAEFWDDAPTLATATDRRVEAGAAGATLYARLDPPQPVTNVALPSVTGQLVDGSMLTASPGTWSTGPLTHSYQWRADGQEIVGATGKTFTVGSGQIGRRLSVAVTPRNLAYTGEVAVSPQTIAVSPRTPVNLDWMKQTHSSIALRWDPVLGATGYRIHHRTAGSDVVTTTSVGNVASAVVDQLTPLTEYTFTVTAVAGEATSPASAPATARTLSTPPPVPTKLHVRNATSSSVNLAWSGSAATYYYRVWFRAGSGAVEHRDVFDKSVTVNRLKPGTSYTFWVTAMTVDDNSSNSTVTVRATTKYPTPARPAKPKLVSTSKTSVSIAWRKVTHATTYRILVKQSGKPARTIKVANLAARKITGLKRGKSYKITVVAVNGSGDLSAASSALTAKTRR